MVYGIVLPTLQQSFQSQTSNGWNMVKHSSGQSGGQGASRCDGDEVVECQSPSGFLLPWVDLEDLPQIQHSSNKEWHEQHLNATEPTFQFHLSWDQMQTP